MSLSHFPTLVLIIGYTVFWFEIFLFSKHQAHSTPIATCLSAMCLLLLLVLHIRKVDWMHTYRQVRRRYRSLNVYYRILSVLTLCLIFGIVCSGIYAYSFPPHLTFEYDALNYHLSLPRQHLIWGNFDHLPWSVADLFPLPLQFAVAPYVFLTDLPNKWVFLFIFLGLITLTFRLAAGYPSRSWSFCAGAAAVTGLLGSHGIGIQVGTAMLDLAICYLFLAAVDSFYTRRWGYFSIELSLLSFSKSFMPILTGLIVTAVICADYLTSRAGFEFYLLKKDDMPLYSVHERRRMILSVLAGCLLFGGPFVAKSIYVAGTPIFPFKPCFFDGQMCKEPFLKSALIGSANASIQLRDAYGHGRGLSNFIKHFWLVSVPEKGVNNAFDYPLGLPFLLHIGPFLVIVGLSAKNRRISVCALIVVLYWTCWWFGSQQSRWLYIPLTIMFITVASSRIIIDSKIFWAASFIALMLNLISISRAVVLPDWSKTSKTVISSWDRPAVSLSEQYMRDNSSKALVVNFKELAYARFPAIVAPPVPRHEWTPGHWLFPVPENSVENSRSQ